MLLIFGLLLIGILCLYLGAEGLIKGASSLALRFGVPPLIIGLTVVAFGTSSPELVISIKTNLAHQGSIAIGNVIGSNIFNIAVILGLTALITPISIKRQLVRLDTPIMLFATLMFVLMFRDFQISQPEAVVFFIGIIAYICGNYLLAKKHIRNDIEAEIEGSVPKPTRNLFFDISFIIVGLLLLVLGSRTFVKGAIELAIRLNVSEAVIGLTIVALGTSLPELATSVVAAIKKQPEIAIGNIIGSNIFNLLCIIGVTGLLAPISGLGIKSFDVLIMVMISVVIYPIMITGLKINRIEGLFLLLMYGGYIYKLWP